MPVINISQGVLLHKPETVIGTDAAPTTANTIKFFNMTFAPMEGEDVPRDFVLGHMGHQGIDVAGLYGRVEFDVQLTGSGAAGVAPAFGGLLRSAGCDEAVTADTQVDYTPLSDGQETGTLWFNDDGVKYPFTAGRGNWQMVWTANRVPLLRFTYLGFLADVTDTARPVPVFTPWQDGLVCDYLNTAFSLHGVPAGLESFNFNASNQVAPRFLINKRSIEMTDRKSAGTVVIEGAAVATKDWIATVKAKTLAELEITHGLVAGNIVEFAAPATQVGRPSYGATNGIRNQTFPTYHRPVTGDDEWTLTFK
ncbi:phage tail tube protein [Methylobrevis pamukkalensis]|uniref:Uncharacterized protein n=1 Tax=Methylobrevis pamukkalensis TaxID=1439726 RepID=A0A1E3H4U7_9HYPH|nr:hypothetical protein [Methylobrevis pamukkalensis]ODN71175.1 hypothetical protein A6302_01464 [Methylobrevis pamukkalensis]